MTTSIDRPLAGQTILVTGASGGIGSAIVRRIAAEGGRPVIHYSRDEGRARGLLEAIGGEGRIVQGDLSVEGGATALWDVAVGVAGRIHGLVNNAGIRTVVRVEDDLSAWHAAWNREFRINLFAAADLSRAAILHFREHGGGRIVNMSSRAGLRGYSAEAMPYGATKAALVNLTKSIARSFGKDGVVAVAIAPGWVEGPMADAFIAEHGEAAALSDIPIGRMASPDEIAETVAFVLRPSQASLSGATIDVNGASYTR